jgi:hypothetical protein
VRDPNARTSFRIVAPHWHFNDTPPPFGNKPLCLNHQAPSSHAIFRVARPAGKAGQGGASTVFFGGFGVRSQHRIERLAHAWMCPIVLESQLVLEV